MSEERRAPGDLIHRENTVKSSTAFLQTTGGIMENIHKKDDARSWDGDCRDRGLCNHKGIQTVREGGRTHQHYPWETRGKGCNLWSKICILSLLKQFSLVKNTRKPHHGALWSKFEEHNIFLDCISMEEKSKKKKSGLRVSHSEKRKPLNRIRRWICAVSS